jgi:hypothetical protein
MNERMTTNLYWRPKATKKNNAGQDSELKWALQKRYGCPINKIIGVSMIDYLQGLADGHVSGAQELIDAIEKHDEIELFEE